MDKEIKVSQEAELQIRAERAERDRDELRGLIESHNLKVCNFCRSTNDVRECMSECAEYCANCPREFQIIMPEQK